jgi:L-threonylcarbamoyladenylate synthase
MAAERLAGDDAGIRRAAELLAAGGLVAFPTDTVYGIGCRAGDAAALQRLFAAKRRPSEKAVPWLVSSLAQAEEAGINPDERARRLADAFWPGGLTLVLSATEGGATQGVRVPDHAVALALISAAGPLATSSANRSGEPETWGADDVAIALADAEELDAILDGGEVPGGVASSVLDLTVRPARLLREGAILRKELEAVIRPID